MIELGIVSKKPLNSRKLKALNAAGMITAHGVSQIRSVGNGSSVPGISGACGSGNGKFRVSRNDGISVTAPGNISVPIKKMKNQRAVRPVCSLLLAYAANAVTGSEIAIAPNTMISEFRA